MPVVTSEGLLMWRRGESPEGSLTVCPVSHSDYKVAVSLPSRRKSPFAGQWEEAWIFSVKKLFCWPASCEVLWGRVGRRPWARKAPGPELSRILGQGQRSWGLSWRKLSQSSAKFLAFSILPWERRPSLRQRPTVLKDPLGPHSLPRSTGERSQGRLAG